MIGYDEPVYRPPSEASSLILQVTAGCSHNSCRFCFMYKNKGFGVKPWGKLEAEIGEAVRLRPETRRVFLADGDAFVLGTDKLERILGRLSLAFPALQRVSAYATPQNLLGKSVEEMKRLRKKGLSILYCGIETGDAELLVRIDKGATPAEMVEGCRRATAAGLKLSVTVIIGLAGREGGLDHARATAALLNRISPRFLSALTLIPGPFEHSYSAHMGNGFRFNSAGDDVRELGELVSRLEVDRCIFRSNHASNYLPLKGTLLKDKNKLLGEIEKALENPGAFLRDAWMRGL